MRQFHIHVFKGTWRKGWLQCSCGATKRTSEYGLDNRKRV